jgi:hypothetical protein
MLATCGPASDAFGRAATARVELAEQVDALGGDRERRPAGGEHAQVGHGRDQERDEAGHRLDQVLAVVKHEQAR